MKNRKIFLDEIAKKLNIKTPSDWGKVSFQQFRELGGRSLLNDHNNSLFKCLQSVYKDINWKREWFKNLPKSYWKSMENGKNFLDEIAKKLNIKTPSDWGKVTARQVCEHGGHSLLRDYDSSLFTCLQSVYKDINWKREWFGRVPKSYWDSMENRRNFLDEIAKKLNIKKPSDWGNVTIQQFYELGGSSLLTKYYAGSLFTCLRSVYKDINWKREWFVRVPKTYWKSMENRKNFLDEIAKKLNIKTPSDWGNVTTWRFYELGGTTILQYYNNSIFTCLQSVYKDINWKREWFKNLPRFPKTYWNSIQNCRSFMDEIAINSNVISPSDWRKVSLSLIRNNGGQGLLHKYQGNMRTILKSIYSIQNKNELISWNPLSSEKILKESIKSIFPEADVSLVPNCRNVNKFI